jgi:hypothetical protein
MRTLILLLLAAWVAPGQASQVRLAGGTRNGSSSQSGKPAALLVYGGRDNAVFLGCLTCGPTDARSIRNESGTYGSRYSTSSMTNPYSDYGSPYGMESACNPDAVKAPVIVDRDGNYYGQFTVNKANPNRTSIASALQLLAVVCGI